MCITGTYVGGNRVRRNAPGLEVEDPLIDMQEAEKRLVDKFGEHVCVYQRVCLYYANRANSGLKNAIDWNELLE